MTQALHLRPLGFRIERSAYPPASRMTGVVIQKVRDDGRRGPPVGDELLLWDALEEAKGKLAQVLQALEEAKGKLAQVLQALEEAKGKLAQVLQALKDETQARLDAEKERDDLREKVKGLADRVAAQSELLSERAEKKGGKKS